MNAPFNPGHFMAGPLVIEMLGSAFPGMIVRDRCYPDVAFYGFGPDVEAAANPADRLGALHKAFYARFRQAGGHLAIPTAMVDGPDGGHLATVRSGEDDPAFGELPSDVTIRIIDGAKPIGAAADPHPLHLTFGYPSHRESYAILAPAPLAPWLADQLRSRTGVEEVVQRAHNTVEIVDAVMQAEDPDGVKVRTVVADRFIHDGPRRSERSGDYSWLWIGPEREVRILLGRLSPRVRRLRIVVPNAFTRSNLLSMRVSLNGRVMEPTVEEWSEGSGALSIALDAHTESPVVIGVSCRDTRRIDDSTTLAVCIDKIELFE